MATGLFYFGANVVALTANLLTGAGLLVSNPRSFNARLFAGVTVSSACYLVGRSFPTRFLPTFRWKFWIWPFLLILDEHGDGALDDPRVLAIPG